MPGPSHLRTLAAAVIAIIRRFRDDVDGGRISDGRPHAGSPRTPPTAVAASRCAVRARTLGACAARVASAATPVASTPTAVRATTARKPPRQEVKWLSSAPAGPPATMATLSPLTTTTGARAVRSGVTRLIAVTAATAQNPA
ncbi:hypothetical protein GCM10010499_33400 [Streptomyces thermoviolaceus subsp. apingens]|nr:hypothetical protein GCM10010499_33400 [Streptomyces thermoviolaceus subsp. apingens]